MKKIVFIFALSACQHQAQVNTAPTAKCEQIFLFSSNCAIEYNSCSNPVISESDFLSRCQTSENLLTASSVR